MFACMHSVSIGLNFFESIFKYTSSAKNNKTYSHNFLLEKECYQTITGSITNELSKEPIYKAIVTLYKDGEAIKNLRVNDDGKYSFNIKCNTNYYIIASKLNYINDLYEFTTSKKENTQFKYDFKLEPECIQTINGTILNKVTKEPLGAQLKLYLNNVKVQTITVNNDGKYAIQFQCTTNYKIVASKQNYFEDSYNFLTDYIENKQQDYFHLKKNLFLEPDECFQVVSGQVLEKNSNKIIPNAILSLIFQNQEIKTFQTNNDGSFYFNVKCNLVYELKAAKNDFNSTLISYKSSAIKDEKQTQNIYIEEEQCKQTLYGIVVDQTTKKPLHKTQIILLNNLEEIAQTTTDYKGVFSFNVSCETSYTLETKNPGYNSKTITFSTSEIKDLSISQSLELAPLVCIQTITGTVIDNSTKLPLINCQIILLNDSNEIKKTTTDLNGGFLFDLNCENHYKIIANNSAYKSETILFTTDKTRNSKNDLQIKLIPLDCNQIVKGTIFDKNTKLPLGNTQIILLNDLKEINKIITDINGTFSLKINCDSNYHIVAKNSNYQSETVYFSTNNKRDSEIIQSIELNPFECKQTVTGIIRDEVSKKPLPNTTITLYKDNKVIKTNTVGDDGIYEFELECSSTYKLTIFKNNNLETFKLKTAIENKRTLTLHIEIEPLICKQHINGIIKEHITDNAIPNATVILTNNSKQISETTSDSNGAFYFEIDCNKPYLVSAEKSSYTKSTNKVFSTNKLSLPHNIILTLEPIIEFIEIKGIKYIETKEILFDLDEFKILNEEKIELNKVVYNMNQNPAIIIEVNYHTDSRGPDEYNMQLTINRAYTTKNYLVSKGIDPSRIIANGYGESRLLNKCTNNVKCTNEEHSINRRTEFKVINK